MRTKQIREPPQEAVSDCKSTLIGAGFRLLGNVRDESGATDLALVNKAGRSVVVRCVSEPAAADYIALATMLAQGDFFRAALVYTFDDEPPLSGEIEAYHISRIEELTAFLSTERPA